MSRLYARLMAALAGLVLAFTCAPAALAAAFPVLPATVHVVSVSQGPWGGLRVVGAYTCAGTSTVEIHVIATETTEPLESGDSTVSAMPCPAYPGTFVTTVRSNGFHDYHRPGHGTVDMTLDLVDAYGQRTQLAHEDGVYWSL